MNLLGLEGGFRLVKGGSELVACHGVGGELESSLGERMRGIAAATPLVEGKGAFGEDFWAARLDFPGFFWWLRHGR